MKKARTEAVPLTVREIEMTIYGLKIWRQVLVGEIFMELREGARASYQETMVDIDLALAKLEKVKGKF